jgi:hypothetical protein
VSLFGLPSKRLPAIVQHLPQGRFPGIACHSDSGLIVARELDERMVAACILNRPEESEMETPIEL